MREELVKRNATEIQDNKFLYKGLKFDFTVHPLEIVSTDTDFYKQIDKKYYKLFTNLYFSTAIKKYLQDKYKRKLDRVEKLIRQEVNGRNNHISIGYLKKMRLHYINKYKDAGNIK
jgi:hypothetical protein